MMYNAEGNSTIAKARTLPKRGKPHKSDRYLMGGTDLP